MIYKIIQPKKSKNNINFNIVKVKAMGHFLICNNFKPKNKGKIQKIKKFWNNIWKFKKIEISGEKIRRYQKIIQLKKIYI